jgi:hypothetical protein
VKTIQFRATTEARHDKGTLRQCFVTSDDLQFEASLFVTEREWKRYKEDEKDIVRARLLEKAELDLTRATGKQAIYSMSL